MKQQNSGLGVEEEHGAAQWSEEGGPEAKVEVEKGRCDRRGHYRIKVMME